MDIFEFIILFAIIYFIYILIKEGLIMSCYIFCVVIIIFYIIKKGIDFLFIRIEKNIFKNNRK